MRSNVESRRRLQKLKDVSVELLANIKEKLAELDHPFDKPVTRAAIDVLIRDYLWMHLPESYPDTSIDKYRQTVFDYAQRHYAF